MIVPATVPKTQPGSLRSIQIRPARISEPISRANGNGAAVAVSHALSCHLLDLAGKHFAVRQRGAMARTFIRGTAPPEGRISLAVAATQNHIPQRNHLEDVSGRVQIGFWGRWALNRRAV
jgi:hypothetical protein